MTRKKCQKRYKEERLEETKYNDRQKAERQAVKTEKNRKRGREWGGKKTVNIKFPK